MRDGRLELQKAIKALVDTALPAAPMYVSLESCTSFLTRSLAPTP